GVVTGRSAFRRSGIEIKRQCAAAAAQSLGELAPLPAVAEAAVDEHDERPRAILVVESSPTVDGDALHRHSAVVARIALVNQALLFFARKRRRAPERNGPIRPYEKQQR